MEAGMDSGANPDASTIKLHYGGELASTYSRAKMQDLLAKEWRNIHNF